MMKAFAASLAFLLIGAANSQSINYPTPLTIIAGAGAPFSGVVVTDPNVGATTDTVTIILSGSAGGSLSGPGLTGSNPYTLTGTPQTITGMLQALTYAPASYGNSQEEFDLTVVSTAITTFGSATGAVQVQNINLTNEVPFPAPTGTFTPRNFKGVNIAGAENAYPSSSQYNYVYPAAIELDYWASKGLGLIRMPLQIRRLQPQSYGMLDPIGRTDEPAVAGSTTGTQTNLLAVKAVLDRALADGLYVVLDPHDYGYIQDTNTNTARLIGADPEATGQFVDWWLRMATVFKNYPNVVFGLMNEPHAQTAAQWQSGAVAAINAIAQVTTSRWVFVPGTAYTGANSWVQSGNGAAWAGYVPPAGLQIAFEMHEYLDSDFSGTHAACAGYGSAPVTSAISWAQTNGYKVWIGETGWSQDPTCPSDATTLMSYFTANEPTVLGWAYWVGGSNAFYAPWNNPGGHYAYSAVPAGYPTGPFTDAPQTSILMGNLN
jgi:endoglucanase